MNLTGQKVRQKLPKPIRDRKHRMFVASLPCLVCAWEPSDKYKCQAAHVRIGWYRGGGSPGDDYTIPLCAPRYRVMGCHGSQHAWRKPQGSLPSAEQHFWDRQGIDPFKIAAALYAVSGDEEKGRLIVLGARSEGKVT